MSTTKSLPTKLRDRNRHRTRMELLEAALDLFDEGGLATCSVDAVAKHAGTSKTTAYAYFPDGINEMLRDKYRMIAERVRLRGEQLHREATSTEDKIVALAEALFEICSEPKTGRFYMMISPALSPLLEPVVGETSSYFGKLIDEDLRRKLPAGWSPAASAVLIVGAAREAAIAIVRDPGQRDSLVNALRMTVRAVLSAKGSR